MHNIHLSYKKTIVDLCFGRYGVLLNSKLNHIDLRGRVGQYDVNCSITLYVNLNMSQWLYKDLGPELQCLLKV